MRQPRLGYLVLVVPVICCGAPLLVAAVVATGAVAWLAANRLFLGSGAALLISVIAVGIWIQQRRRMR
jgi:hypothetical protein